MVIRFIYGMSGCAKTTTALKLLNSGLTFRCIAFTHSAVNNLRDMYSKMYSNKLTADELSTYFMTIHKFLRIRVSENYANIKRPHIELPECVIVDEFSLIPLDIIDMLFELGRTTSCAFVFVGDFIQLMPIATIRQPISLNLLQSEFSEIPLTFNEAIRIADHLSNSVYTSSAFQSAKKLVLLHNYRNGSHVCDVLNDALNGHFKPHIIQFNRIKEYVADGYVVISSMYVHLERAYGYSGQFANHVEQHTRKTRIGYITIDIDDQLVLSESIEGTDYMNGDVVSVMSLGEMNYITVVKPMSEPISIDAMIVMPHNFITCHKAQGRTIPRVLLVLDDLFEITMLYTSITRASEDIKFIKFKYQPNEADLNAFKHMRDVIYRGWNS